MTPSAYTANEDFTRSSAAVLSDLGEPGAPLDPIAGDAHGQRWVTAGLLARWHASRG